MCNDPRIITEYEQNLAEQFLRNKMIADANSKGIKQGIEQGIEQGIKEEKTNIAKKMIKENIETETISKITGLTKEEIAKLK